MCAACKELGKVWDISQQLITAFFYNRKNGNPSMILTQQKENGECGTVCIEIRYCPWCGRDLMRSAGGNE